MATEIKRVESKYQGWSNHYVVTLRLSDGRIIRREIEHHGKAVSVLPFDHGSKTAVLVCQLRVPVFFTAKEENLLEAIAGIMEEGEDPPACARREALEEAGLKLGSLEHVATGWTMPGISTEQAHLYLAPYSQSDRCARPNPDKNEILTPVEMSLDELARMVDAGRIADVKTLALIQTLRLRRPELFVG